MDDHIITVEGATMQIINNLRNLAQAATNNALTNIIWSADAPFALLRGIFENIVNGWKETLVTALRDRSLRFDLFKGLLFRMDRSNSRVYSICQSIFNGNREMFSIMQSAQQNSVNILSNVETSFANVFQRFNQISEVCTNNQKIIVKFQEVSINYMM
jgi:hypothetical protein